MVDLNLYICVVCLMNKLINHPGFADAQPPLLQKEGKFYYTVSHSSLKLKLTAISFWGVSEGEGRPKIYANIFGMSARKS